jgi:hypothetical protein
MLCCGLELTTSVQLGQQLRETCIQIYALLWPRADNLCATKGRLQQQKRGNGRDIPERFRCNFCLHIQQNKNGQFRTCILPP